MSGFAIATIALMMFTSQMPLAFADRTCTGLISDETITENITVPSGNSFTICVLDNVNLKGNITVEANAAVFVINGSDLESDIKLLGQFSAINFEGTKLNTLKGNVQGEHTDSYIFLDSVNIDGNVQAKGELYTSSSRGSGPVTVQGNYIVEGDFTDEFTLAAGSVGGNILVSGQLSIRIADTVVGGNVHIKDNANTSGPDSNISIGFNTIGGHLELEKNTFDTVVISNNDIDKGLQLLENDSPIELNNNDVGQNANCDKNQSVSGDETTNFIGQKAKKECKNLFESPTQNFP